MEMISRYVYMYLVANVIKQDIYEFYTAPS